MALSCCRILTRHSTLSLQSVLKNSHVTFRRITPKCQWTEDVGSSHTFRIISRNFRNRRTGQSSQTVSSESQGQGDSFSLFKSTSFVTGVCSCSFVGAMIWNYENVRKVYKDIAADKAQNSSYASRKALGFRQHLNAVWENIDASAKLTFGIIAANIAVWVLWKVPRLQPGMIRYFSSAAAHPRTSMILSSFSHISVFHLFVNMYVLLSFAPVITRVFGREQFSAFYVSAGTFSAFTSILCQKFLKRPLAVSVGASGAIMGLLGVTGLLYPSAQLQVAFVSEIFPHSFSAETGIKAIILFDILGLVMGWKVLDHAGHLGGMLFGLWYAKYGSKLIWSNRDPVVKFWHGIRGKP